MDSAYPLSINKMRNGRYKFIYWKGFAPEIGLMKIQKNESGLSKRWKCKGRSEEIWTTNIRILARSLRADGDSRTGKSGTRHLLKNTKNKAIPCPRKKVLMIAMNAALEDVYKRVFADSYQHGAPLSRRAWKGRGYFDRMNRNQLIDILIEASRTSERFFRSLCADWMRTRAIDGWTRKLREWRDRPNLK